MTENLEQIVIFHKDFNLSIACYCEIVNVELNSADTKNNKYNGNVTAIDHIEHSFKFTSGWKAYPGEEEHVLFGKKYKMNIECTDEPIFFKKGYFTLQPDVDEDLKHYIMHAILEYKERASLKS